MSATPSPPFTAPRSADRSVELAYRGASAEALSHTPSPAGISRDADGMGLADPSVSTRTFAQRQRAAVSFSKQRKALVAQAAKLKQSLARLETLNVPSNQLWDHYFSQGREYRTNVAYAVLGTASFVGFLVGVAGTAGAVKTAREMRVTRAVIEAGGIEAQKQQLEGQLAYLDAQLAQIEVALTTT